MGDWGPDKVTVTWPGWRMLVWYQFITTESLLPLNWRKISQSQMFYSDILIVLAAHECLPWATFPFVWCIQAPCFQPAPCHLIMVGIHMTLKAFLAPVTTQRQLCCVWASGIKLGLGLGWRSSKQMCKEKKKGKRKKGKQLSGFIFHSIPLHMILFFFTPSIFHCLLMDYQAGSFQIWAWRWPRSPENCVVESLSRKWSAYAFLMTR